MAHGHVFLCLPDIFRGGTHDAAVVELVFQVVGHPARDACCGKKGSIKLFRNPEHAVGEAGVEIDIGADGPSLALHDDFLCGVFKEPVEGKFVHAAKLLREVSAELSEELRTGIADGVDRMAEAVQKSAVVEIVLVQNAVYDRTQLVLV